MSIALCAIVKDEISIIEAMFASVEGIADTWVVIDTGSTDGTYEWLKEYQEKHPGTLAQSVFTDFGTSRTELMKLAKGKADYLLLLDADMALKITTTEPVNLSEDVYLLEHVGEPNRYWVERLVRGDVDWSFGGRTHEYLVRDDGKSVEAVHLSGLVVVPNGEGSSRSIKYERDVELLLQDWEDSPRQDRTACYLASTYGFMGNTEEQERWLRKHIEIGDPASEEVFVSQFRLGLVRNDSAEMMKAWLLRPHRVEPIAWIAQKLCLEEDFERAYHVAKVGLSIPYPEQDTSFIAVDAYEYDVLFQFSVAAFNTGRVAEAVKAGRELLGRNLPPEVRQIAESNLRDFLGASNEQP